jgi:hypothetical protein
MGASISPKSVRDEIGIDTLPELDPPVDEFVLFEMEVGAAVEEVGDGLAMAKVDEGAGEIHGNGAVGQTVRAGGVGGGEEFGESCFLVVALESDLAESLVSKEDGVAVARVAGEVRNDLDEGAGMRFGGVELAGGKRLANRLGEAKKAIGFVGAGQEFVEGAGREGGAFGVFGGLSLGGERLRLVRLADS